MTSTTPTSDAESSPVSPKRAARILARTAIISAYAATILVPTGFAKIAIAPIVLVLLATLAGPSVRRLWWAATALFAVYAIPFIQYAADPDREQSLSKDMDPVWWVIIPIVGVVYIVSYHVGRACRSR
ncbi:hypothetical protein [Brevibacterium oceani]|uniref:hypothetical protein n=1 Tax=Brevibacterium oceani TaxID=358099 RepID=UPI001B32FD41|nr:hypothetical protein [Brevibacterium oceani]